MSFGMLLEIGFEKPLRIAFFLYHKNEELLTRLKDTNQVGKSRLLEGRNEAIGVEKRASRSAFKKHYYLLSMGKYSLILRWSFSQFMVDGQS